MTLHDLRDGGGCPRCVGGQESFHWSGAGLAVAEVLAGGAERLGCHEKAGWPAWERARCQACGAIWHFVFHWHDHPPLVLTGTVVEPDAGGGPEAP